MNANLYHTRAGDTICALSTPPGMGAIAVIRLSGPRSLPILSGLFTPFSKSVVVEEIPSHTLTLGMFGTEEEVIDEVLVSVFRNPHSYTGEDVAEISCHGSVFIQQQILQALTHAGARMAKAGEFTLRAFMNGKFDLAQAEAVADLIAAHSRSEHDLAIRQMRGGFSKQIRQLRQKLVDLASLFELELDFSEEDVEFADRKELTGTLRQLEDELVRLSSSFSLGNVIKQGVPVAIIGKPNVGKSTLLNALLNEERAIVSEIPGTTRDTIEDTLTVEGIKFRFIDTAGLRSHTDDSIESIGIGRTYEKIREARIILYVCDMSAITTEEIDRLMEEFSEHIADPDKQFILIGNKTDLMVSVPKHISELFELETIFVSAKRKENIHMVMDSLLRAVSAGDLKDSSIISNVRHYEAINRTVEALRSASKGLADNLPTDLVATDIRSALFHLGSITGEVTTEEVLGNIFSKFCIGK